MKGCLYIIISVMILVMSGCSNEQSAEVNKIKSVDVTESGRNNDIKNDVIEKDSVKDTYGEKESFSKDETTSVLSENIDSENNTVESNNTETKELEDKDDDYDRSSDSYQIVEVQTTSTEQSKTERATNSTTAGEKIDDETITTEFVTTEEATSEIVSNETITEQETTEEETTSNTVIEYNPDRVCALATAICEEAGLKTTADSMDEMLANGLISQEEYDEFYPYAGAGYLGVFLETDLSIACTITGRKLSSEQAIAEYLAEVMISEATDEFFFIECAGIYIHNGVPMYEFRCYR
ncbi:MAG: hypothetical protein J6L69_06685 [Lachnospiraceae bacterium]|nr:hypothetical protein [Lachnospiraceae bacterium]